MNVQCRKRVPRYMRYICLRFPLKIPKSYV